MMAVVTTGHGGLDRLEYREVPVPEPAAGEVLLRVLAAGVNNTEINTRLGWYSASVDGRDGGAARPRRAARAGRRRRLERGDAVPPDPGHRLLRPRRRGRPGRRRAPLGRRVLVRPCMRPTASLRMETIWMGSDFDGAFAQFVTVPARRPSPWSAPGATPSWARSPAPTARRRTCCAAPAVAAGDARAGHRRLRWRRRRRRAARQAARRRTSRRSRAARRSADVLRGIGADRVVARDDDLVGSLGAAAVDVVVDNVVGAGLRRRCWTS